MRGKIVQLQAEREIGYIETRDGEKLYFNRLGLAGYPFKSFSIGDKVEFEVEEAAKGPRAVRIRMTM